MITTCLITTSQRTYRSYDDNALKILRRVYNIDPKYPVGACVLGAYKPMDDAQLARWRRNGSRGDHVRRLRDHLAIHRVLDELVATKEA